MAFEANYPLLGTIFTIIPLFVTVYLHQITFKNNFTVILTATFLSTVIYYFGDQFAFAENIWEVTDQKSIGLRIGHTPIEQIVFTLTSSMLISFVTILMYNCYIKNKRFRDIYFKKEMP